MLKNRKYLIVHFANQKCAEDAFKLFRMQNPSRLYPSEDFSRVEGNIVYIQEGSFSIPRKYALDMLMECYGAFSISD